MSAFDSFGELDEIIQVIYQGAQRFVVLSNVEFGPIDPGWDVHVGLGDVGRWWKGRWTDSNLNTIVGSSTSSTLLEAFAEKLARTFVDGELYIGDWSEDKDAAIKIVFGSSSTQPLSMPLTEMSPKDAAVYATSTLISIALAAQSRKCQLNPPAYPATGNLASTSSRSPASARKRRERTPSPPLSSAGGDHALGSNMSVKEFEEEIKALRAQVAEEQRKSVGGSTTLAAPKTLASQSKLHGTSLAKPQKKARRVQEMKFADDE